MAIDISNDPQTLALRDKWTARGVPPSLFDAFIAEANAEYNSTIGFEDYNRFAQLNVICTDTDETENCYYFYSIMNYGLNMSGVDDYTTAHLFAGVPCVSLDIQVFKIKTDNSECVAYGTASLLHSKDESIEITLTTCAMLNQTRPIILTNETSGRFNFNGCELTVFATITEIQDLTPFGLDLYNNTSDTRLAGITCFGGSDIYDPASPILFANWIAVKPHSYGLLQIVQYRDCFWRLQDSIF
jgi:hypothetical protein